MSDTALRKLCDVTCDLLETMIHVAQSKRTLVISFHNLFIHKFYCMLSKIDIGEIVNKPIMSILFRQDKKAVVHLL